MSDQNSVPTAVKRFKPSKLTWTLAAIAVLLIIVFTASGGFPGFLIIVGILGLLAGLWAIAMGHLSSVMIRSRKAGLIVAASGLVLAIIGGASAPPTNTSHVATAISAPIAHHKAPSKPAQPSTSRSTPTPTPTPTLAVDAVTAQVAADASSALTQHGFTVVFVDASGAPVADPTGWTVASENPAAGASIPVGSTVTLTVTPPPPPAAAPVVQPAPAPARPAPVAPGGGATAKCRDGSLSFSAHRQGTCSHHGGVAIWY